jgi:predicted MFS family arabinose efflux permease
LGEVKKGKLFDFKHLWQTLFDPDVGVVFMISLIFFMAFSCAILYGFQPFVTNILKLSQSQNAMLFTMYGVVGLISQSFLVGYATKLLGMKRAFIGGLFFVTVAFLLMSISKTIAFFVFASIVLGVVNSIVQTLLPTILSQEADAKSQGSIMGLNASYQSIGMIIGPILGGAIATEFSIPSTFLGGAVLVMICFFLSFKVLRKGMKPESAF